MIIDEHTLRSLIDFDDPTGVLSVYAGFTPEQAGDPQPTAPIEIRNQLDELRRSLREDGSEDREAVDGCLDELGDTLGGVLDPKAHGRGRALFVGVAGGRRESIALQMPFRERVVYRDRAFVRPLVAAYDEGRPAGIVVPHRDGARILEWSVGEAEQLEERTFELGDAQLADIKSGPSANNPRQQQQGLVNRERFEDRIDDNRRRFLRDTAGDLAALAADRGWDRLVIAGTPKVREVLADALPDNGVQPLSAEQSWEGAAPHIIALQAWPILRSMHRQREVELVEAAKERALGGGAGALGLADTLDAVNRGRVEHLLFGDDLVAEGWVSDQDTLHADPADATGLELQREELLVERMVEKVMQMSGRVTPVDEQAAASLAEHGAVGALLRW